MSLKKITKGLKKQYKIVKPKIKKGYRITKKKYKKLKPKIKKHSRRISRNIDYYFDECSRQIREFKPGI